MRWRSGSLALLALAAGALCCALGGAQQASTIGLDGGAAVSNPGGMYAGNSGVVYTAVAFDVDSGARFAGAWGDPAFGASWYAIPADHNGGKFYHDADATNIALRVCFEDVNLTDLNFLLAGNGGCGILGVRDTASAGVGLEPHAADVAIYDMSQQGLGWPPDAADPTDATRHYLFQSWQRDAGYIGPTGEGPDQGWNANPKGGPTGSDASYDTFDVILEFAPQADGTVRMYAFERIHNTWDVWSNGVMKWNPPDWHWNGVNRYYNVLPKANGGDYMKDVYVFAAAGNGPFPTTVGGHTITWSEVWVKGTVATRPVVAWVDSTWSGPNDDGGHTWGYDGFSVIQSAVDAVEAAGTVNVAAGTYQEQVQAGKSITLDGAPGAIIMAPAAPGTVRLDGSSTKWQPVLFLYGGTKDGTGNVTGTAVSTVDVSGFTIDGNDRVPTGRSAGILLRNVDGTISGNVIQDMNVDGQETFGVMVYGDSDVTIDGNTVSGFSRGGIGVMSGHAVISDNVVIGPDDGVTPITWAPNGIQIGYGAHGTISGNYVTGCGWPGTDWAGTAIMVVDTSDVLVEGNFVQHNETGIGVTDFPAALYGSAWAGVVSDVAVVGNELVSNEWGLDIVNDASDVVVMLNSFRDTVHDAIDVYSYDLYYPGLGIPYPSNVAIHYNSIENSGGDGLWVMDGIGAPVDATLNWWGDVGGPSGEGSGAGDSVSTNVIFSPWLGTNPDGDPVLAGVQITGPALIVVDDVGPAPAGGYLDAAIGGANGPVLTGNDTVLVMDGTFTASTAITNGVSLFSANGACKTTINGSLVLDSANTVVGRMRGGFTLNGPITVGAGIDATSVHINWNDIYDVVTNQGNGWLDATYNFWGEDGPDTVGFVDTYPSLPVTNCTLIGYMDDYGLTVGEAITFAALIVGGSDVTEAQLVLLLVNDFGLSVAEALALIDDYGAPAVNRAALTAWDIEELMVYLAGYTSSIPEGGAGSGLEGDLGAYPIGTTVPVMLVLADPFTGEPVTDAVVSFGLTRVLPSGTPQVVRFGAMEYSPDLEVYLFELDTTGLEPGGYKVWLGSDDGRTVSYTIVLTE